jgi:hypothetical protein
MVHFACAFVFFGYPGRQDVAGCSNSRPIPETRYLRRTFTITGEWFNGDGGSGTYSTTNRWFINRWTGEETAEWGNRICTGAESGANLGEEGPEYQAEIVEDFNTRYKLVRHDLRNSTYAMSGTETTEEVFDEPYNWSDFIAACDALYFAGSNQIITLLREQTLLRPNLVFTYDLGLAYGAGGVMVPTRGWNVGAYASRGFHVRGYESPLGYVGTNNPGFEGHASAVVVRAGTYHMFRSFNDPCSEFLREYGKTDTVSEYPLGIVELIAGWQELKQLGVW